MQNKSFSYNLVNKQIIRGYVALSHILIVPRIYQSMISILCR